MWKKRKSKRKKAKPDKTKLTAQERLLLKEIPNHGDRSYDRKLYGSKDTVPIQLSDGEIVLTPNIAAKILNVSEDSARRVIDSIQSKGYLELVKHKCLTGRYRTNIFRVISKTESKSLILKGSLSVSDGEIRINNNSPAMLMEPLKAPHIACNSYTIAGEKIVLTELNYEEHLDSEHPNVRSQACFVQMRAMELGLIKPKPKIEYSEQTLRDRQYYDYWGYWPDVLEKDMPTEASYTHSISPDSVPPVKNAGNDKPPIAGTASLEEAVCDDPKSLPQPPEQNEDADQEKLIKRALWLLGRERRTIVDLYRGIVAVTPVSCFLKKRHLLYSYGSKSNLRKAMSEDYLEYSRTLDRITNRLKKEDRNACERQIAKWGEYSYPMLT